MKPAVFVGSSREGLPVAERVRKVLHESCAPILWSDDPVFTAGETTVESLAAAADNLDLAVMVWTKDDDIRKRGVKGLAPRDNVILEYGYFSAALGRSRCLILGEEGVVVPTDVNGITYVPFKRDPKGDVLATDRRRVRDRLLLAARREGIRPDRRCLVEFANGQVLAADQATQGVLSLGVRGLGLVSDVKHSLGLHLWLLVDTDGGPRMRRFGRERLGDRAAHHNWGDFEIGRGIPGQVWQTGMAIQMPLTAKPYSVVASEKEWQRLSAAQTHQMSWHDFSRARTAFSALTGVAVHDSSGRVVGALSANVGRSVQSPTGLFSDASRNWLEEVSAAIAAAVPGSLLAAASEIAQSRQY